MGADAPEHASVARGTNGLVRPDGPRKVPARPYGCRFVKGGYDGNMKALRTAATLLSDLATLVVGLVVAALIIGAPWIFFALVVWVADGGLSR